jgi:cardiolipin synthase
MVSSSVKLIEGGPAFFKRLHELIEQSQHKILVEVYLLQDDETGRSFLRSLAQAAQRGVKVRLVVDGLGTNLSAAQIESLRHAGIEWNVFRPFSTYRLGRSLFKRLHRKTFCFDQQIALVGGFNIANDYALPQVPAYKWDYAAEVSGELALRIAEVCDRFIEACQRTSPVLWRDFFPGDLWKPVEGPHRYLIHDSFLRQRSIAKEYALAIDASSKRIILANAYFFPSRLLLKKLMAARNRGVRIQLILQGKWEFWWMGWATQYFYTRLMAAGVEIYEFQSALLHSKIGVIDQKWSTVGSCNLEPWSLISNLEGNLVSVDSEFAQKVQASLERLIEQDCGPIQVTPPHGFQKILSWLCFSAVRLSSRIIQGKTDTLSQ